MNEPVVQDKSKQLEDEVVNNPDFQTVGNTTVDNPSMTARNVNVFYAAKQAIFNGAFT